MRKYILATLIVILIVVSGVHRIQSQMEEIQYNKQNINIDQPIQPIRSTNSDVVKISQNDNYIMQATAYDLSKQCCTKSYSNPSRGITRSGYNLTNKTCKQAFTVASNRFPMGTKLKLTFPSTHRQYDGIYTVRDSGNFKQNVLDVYVGDYGEKVHPETIKFGKVEVQVEMIE